MVGYNEEHGRVEVRVSPGPMVRADGERVIQVLMNRVDERPLVERAKLAWYRCTSCGGDFDTREGLAGHEREVHGKSVAGLVQRAMEGGVGEAGAS